jgi:ribonuclease E
LPSGGAVIIDHTEALISIDINSARATKGSDIEETALNTNREAAEEIGRQLRLRDIGGLIVIDFIDMLNTRNQREVENTMRESLRMDRARVQVGKISRFGLLEMSRQRLRPSLGESSHIPCPRCDGQGTIRDVESLALSVLRIIEEEAMKDMTAKIIARVPVDAATFLLNEKRQPISEIQHRLDVEILVIPDRDMVTPQYLVQRVRLTEAKQDENQQASYLLKAEGKDDLNNDLINNHRKPPAERPAVKQFTPNAPVPAANKKNKIGLLAPLLKMLGSLFSSSEKEKPSNSRPNNRSRNYRTRNNRGNNPNRDRQGQGRNQQRRNKNNPNQNNQQRRGNKRNDQNQDQNKDQSENSSNNNNPNSANRNSNSRRRSRGGRRRKPENTNENVNKESNSNSVENPSANKTNQANASDNSPVNNTENKAQQNATVQTPVSTVENTSNEITQINPNTASVSPVQGNKPDNNKTELNSNSNTQNQSVNKEPQGNVTTLPVAKTESSGNVATVSENKEKE